MSVYLFTIVIDGEGGTSEGAVVVEQGTGEDGSGHSNGRPPEGEEEGTEDGSGKEAGQGGGSGDSEDISPTESGDTEEGEGVSSEWTQSSSEVESLGWIRGLHILPIVHIVPHLPTPPPSSPSSTSTSSSLWDATRGSAADGDLDQLLAELEVCMCVYTYTYVHETEIYILTVLYRYILI